jgi:hypothetical protein
MPLTEKGQKIKRQMVSQYGPKKGEEVFYASKNAGKITGVDDAHIAPHPGKSGHKGGYAFVTPDDNQHLGFTEGFAEPIKKLISQCDGLATRIDAFEHRRAMQKPKKVEPRTKDNMQPSMPHPKEPGG